MATVVEISATEGFILDDPVYGVLDTSELGGEVFRDISSALITASIARGKNRELDRFTPGRFAITLNNEDRRFDPNYTPSPLFGDIIPRRKVKVTVDGIQQFIGVVQDYNFDYDPDSRSKASFVATDEMGLLARQTLTAGTATPQATGDRVSAVLDMESVNWPEGDRNIDTGLSTLGADVFDASGNALEYLQKVEASENGQLFVGKNGQLFFRDRSDATPRSTTVTTFADDGTGIQYSRVEVSYGTELLFNTATVSTPVGNATATNQGSRTTYGVTSTSISTLLSTVEQAGNLANFTVQKYGNPEYRVEKVIINLRNLATADKATVLGLELGDITKFIFTPNGLGDPIEQFGQIIKIDHKIDQNRHEVSIGVTSLDWTFLVLDDALFGILDSDHLAF